MSATSTQVSPGFLIRCENVIVHSGRENVSAHLDLRPLWITGEGDEEIGIARRTDDAHGIFVHVLEVRRASNDVLAYGGGDSDDALSFPRDTIHSLDEPVPVSDPYLFYVSVRPLSANFNSYSTHFFDLSVCV